MKTKFITLHHTNMYCQNCFNNVILALSEIETIEFLNIDMINRCLKIKYKDSKLDNNSIRSLVNNAVTSGRI